LIRKIASKPLPINQFIYVDQSLTISLKAIMKQKSFTRLIRVSNLKYLQTKVFFQIFLIQQNSLQHKLFLNAFSAEAINRLINRVTEHNYCHCNKERIAHSIAPG
jgi:hypothetical protein